MGPRYVNNQTPLTMKYFILTMCVIASLPLHGQRIFFQLQPEAGISSFTPGIIPFEIRSSYQVTLSGGLQLTDRSSVKLGVGVQQSGSRSSVGYFSAGVWTYESLYHDTYFIKIPVDYTISLGRRGLFSLDAGAYYNVNITDRFVDIESDDYLPFVEADISRDDAGIRIRPAVNLQLAPGSILSLGILQEFGLVAFVPRTHHYNTYLSAGLKVKL